MKNRGFVLLEVILAVAVFAIGVIALGRCANNCMIAERLKEEDMLAGQALQNRMEVVEGGALPLASTAEETLKQPLQGMKLKQTVEPLKMKNENDQDMPGLYSVTLTVTWTNAGEPHEKTIKFYALQTPR